jgi:hypothetical protein
VIQGSYHQRMTARSRLKQRLTKTLTPPPTNEMEITIFESEDEGEEDMVMDEKKDDDEIIEDEVLSRLRRQEQEYLQEQEETKSEVLESTTGSTTGSATGNTMEEMMEEMMERKIKIRIDQMEQTSMVRQENRVTQIELITNNRVAQVQSDITEAETRQNQLNAVLTIMTYKTKEADVVLTTLSHQIGVARATIEEADETTNAIIASIQEVHEATFAMIDCKDAEGESRAEFIQRADAFKTAYGKDAKAISTGIQKAKQTLINTKDKMMIELASTAPNPTSIELTKQAIEKEYQKAIAEVRAEKDRNMKNINNKSRSVQDEMLKLIRTTRNEISTTTTEALDSLDITLATVLDQAYHMVGVKSNHECD